jgi:hypothetical protein
MAGLAVLSGDHVNAARSAPSAPGSTVAAGCSKATASKVMTRYRIGVVEPVQPRTPIFQVLCGPFLGPGSRGMVASVAIPSCGGSVGWAVFRLVGGTWRLVMKQNHGAFLAAVGPDIREEIGVLARGDAHCFPSSVKYRFWHWNGRRLQAGPWARAHSFDSFVSPDATIWCGFVAYPTAEARCANHEPVIHTVRLRRSGVLTVCDTRLDCLRGFGRENAYILRHGQANEWAGFHCLSEQKGVTCTVIGGKAAGRGFLVNADGVTPVAP